MIYQEEFQNSNIIQGYHAHVYFDQSTLEQAKALCQKAGKLFSVTVGRIHCQPIGPHPCWSCQLAFTKNQFSEVVSWLVLNRKDLTILVHPLTGNDLLDHTNYALWMGKTQKLNLEVFETKK